MAQNCTSIVKFNWIFTKFYLLIYIYIYILFFYVNQNCLFSYGSNFFIYLIIKYILFMLINIY